MSSLKGLDRQELRIKDSVGENTPAYGAGRRATSKEGRGVLIKEERGKLGTSWDLKDKARGFQRDGPNVSGHLRRIKVKEIPLDLARGTLGDLSVA